MFLVISGFIFVKCCCAFLFAIMSYSFLNEKAKSSNIMALYTILILFQILVNVPFCAVFLNSSNILCFIYWTVRMYPELKRFRLPESANNVSMNYSEIFWVIKELNVRNFRSSSLYPTAPADLSVISFKNFYL
jgi:hypothetical protein